MFKFFFTAALCIFPSFVKGGGGPSEGGSGDDSGCNLCYGRRREMLLAPSFSPKCLEEDYKLYGYVEEGKAHINLIAAPAALKPISECSTPLVFTDMGEGIKALAPAAVYFDDDAWTTQASNDEVPGFLPLGTFSLEALQRAMDASTAVEAGKYNALTDNCATFILGMMQELDIPANKRAQEFVVDSIEKSPSFINLVRDSPDAKGHFGVALEDKTDREVLSMLVDIYVQMHYPTSSE